MASIPIIYISDILGVNQIMLPGYLEAKIMVSLYAV